MKLKQLTSAGEEKAKSQPRRKPGEYALGYIDRLPTDCNLKYSTSAQNKQQQQEQTTRTSVWGWTVPGQQLSGGTVRERVGEWGREKGDGLKGEATQTWLAYAQYQRHSQTQSLLLTRSACNEHLAPSTSLSPSLFLVPAPSWAVCGYATYRHDQR